MYRNVIKPAYDRITAFCLFILALPLILLITILLFITLKGNPFFTQLRPGKDERLFRLIKFRTMTNEKDDKGNLLPDRDRLTKVGSIIRKTSLDELTQLINVLKGDMSLVGPRPLLVKYLGLYDQEQRKRHNVKPGITGWAQVNGRNQLSWEEKFILDVWYVDNVSFKLDLKILLMTLKKVFKGEDIAKQGSVTTTPFKGNSNKTTDFKNGKKINS